MKSLFYTICLIVFIVSCSPYKKLQSFQNSKYGTVEELVHKKSGAKLVLLKNTDPSRLFSIQFRTPPYDDSGLFHIFEHAVLAGSRLYPSKSNFRNVSKSSITGYINAYTSSVSTTYPFMTLNPKDFDNLLSVYMDAVFFPNVLKEARIMKREGWHYELDPKTKQMSIKGIVFSEMSGRYSNIHNLIFQNLAATFVPNTAYSYNSGGLPSKISSLGFEQLLSAHKKYYHPENSFILLYGDIDFTKTLATIDKSFLSHFTNSKDFKAPEIALQTDFSSYKKTPLVKTTYPGPKVSNKDIIVQGYVLGKLNFVDRYIGYILFDTFVDKPSSPLKLRISKENLADLIQGFYGVGGENLVASFVLQQTSASKLERIKKVITEEIDKVVEKGLDQELLTSVLNQYEFSEKETKSGLSKYFSLSGLLSDYSLYSDSSLSESLDLENLFKKIREQLNNTEFVKSFFKKHFKDNQKVRWLLMEPDPNYHEALHTELKQQVTKALEVKSLAEYEKEDKDFKQWVAEKETKEILNKTPILKLSDIKLTQKAIPFTKSKQDTYELIEYPQSNDEISYINLFFDLKGVKTENIKKLNLFSTLLKQTDTTNSSFQNLSKQIGIHIGKISFYPQVYQSHAEPQNFKPFMKVELSFLNQNKEKSLALLKELLVDSNFSPKKQAQDILNKTKIQVKEDVLADRAPDLPLNFLEKSFFPALGSFNNELQQSSYVEYVLKSDLKAETLIPEFQLMLKNIFNQDRLKLVTLVGNSTNLKSLKTDIETLKESLPKQASTDQEWDFSKQKNYEAFAFSKNIQYVTEVVYFKPENLNYSGALKVYGTYLNSNYMTPRLREQLGAYGGWNTFTQSGLWYLQTYRDPNLNKSFEVFSQAVNFMKKEEFTTESIKPAILGALQVFYQDKSASKKADFMTSLYLKGKTWEQHLKTKQEIVQTQAKDFKKISEALAKAMKNSKKSVAGNKDKIKKEAPFLKNVLSLP